ncbi:cyclin-like protein [Crepidotus variabilis]|uniref:Cyclin-like protein n=1 Tax=Crepidotus variabilis TaxID=179855 RepID=A0A9P6EB10_9AGAR|nr:cyclin-like protein [Crepidotus variabilis]
MSSSIPTRRLVRTTRTTAIKENENANARPSRIATRTKPGALNSGTSATAAPAGGVSRPTAASKAKALTADSKVELPAGKRKREALGEVAVAGNKPSSATVKGKQKETFDGVVVKTRPPTSRPPLKTVASRQTTVTTREKLTKEVKVEVVIEKDHAMVVDPVQIPSITTRRSNLPSDSIPAASRRASGHRRTSSRLSARAKVEVEEEEEPVHKKRRTSSVPPEDELEVPELNEEEIHNIRLAAEMEAFANETEADPETSAWDDLDAEDSDDPLMVSEYVQDIVKYLKQVELTTMPNPNYMESQKELAWKMRGILTDWLIQVHVRFRLLPETLFLAVNIIDRFLSARVVSLAKLQLVGVTCLFIAAKFEEIIAPSVSHFLMCADSSYTESEILQAERYVLKTLDWNLSYPNPVHFLRRVSKADEYNVKVRTLAKYLLEVGVLEWRLIAAPPSLMAAASIWLARLALGMENWSPNLAHYSSYRESELVPTASLMLNYILKPIRHESFHKKYAGKRFFKSSVFMREWALDRWSEGAQVDLSSELLRLKAEIKLEREAEEAAQLMREDSKDLAAEYAALQQLRARAADA